MDITRHPSDTWIVDFGVSMSEEEASLYELAFQHVVEHVKPMRVTVRREGHRKYWWRYGETRSGMRKALQPFKRFIGTPRVAKHRLFVWVDKAVLPDCQVVAIARDDNTTFGILHSRFHEIWGV
jgi:type II restriction/modification system DNA methylase subunit YeeA